MARQQESKPELLVVSPTKFIIFTIITFGLYLAYWGWRAWEVVRVSRGETYKTKSSVRGFFLNFSSFTLLPQLEELAVEAGYKRKHNYDVQLLAGAYLAMNFIAARAPLVFSIPAAIIIPFLFLPSLQMFNYYVSHTKKELPPKKANVPLIIVLIIVSVGLFAIGLTSIMQY
jgi:hypothetical protein